MNIILKIVLTTWIISCALFVWFACALIGLILAFSNFSFMYNVTPFIGLTAVAPMFYTAYRIITKSKS